jgi:hypothetical protein
MNPRFMIIPIIAFLAAATIATTDGPKISVQGTTRTQDGIQFSVLIKNSGHSSVFLEETREGSRDPYAINIEQLQPEGNWVSIGPRRDVPAASVFELKPDTKIEKIITVQDPYVDLRSAPHKQYSIRGRHRASIRYFVSPSAWSDSIRNFRQNSILVYSEAISMSDDAGLDH